MNANPEWDRIGAALREEFDPHVRILDGTAPAPDWFWRAAAKRLLERLTVPIPPSLREQVEALAKGLYEAKDDHGFAEVEGWNAALIEVMHLLDAPAKAAQSRPLADFIGAAPGLTGDLSPEDAIAVLRGKADGPFGPPLPPLPLSGHIRRASREKSR